MQTIPILIPCYQEERFIEACVRSVLAFDLPHDVAIEVFVIDGMSTDRTWDIASGIAREDARVRVLRNPKRTQSAALNIGLEHCRGSYVMRLDAHATYPQNYLVECYSTAERTGAANVGGLFITTPRGPGYEPRLVQALTTHPFGVGNAWFRVDGKEGPADTVPYGFFRRDVLQKVGGFDERLVRAQDYELNRRILASGGVIWLNPAIRLTYFQQATLRAFLRKQFFLEAPYTAYMWWVAPYTFALRHAATTFFVLGLVAGLALWPVLPLLRPVFVGVLALYGVLAVTSAVQQAVRYREARHAILLPPSFLLFHVAHGLGSVVALARMACGLSPVPSRRRAPAAAEA